jgi:two-component system, OmpR family, phosphate regulon response regulator PhoB
MENKDLKILCIEDDPDTCELVTFVFEEAGYEIETCSQLECLKLLREQKFQAVILDNYFYGTSGVEICRELRSFDQATPIIFFSGEARQTEIDKALAAGANEYLIKPNGFEQLLPTTIHLIEESRK